MKKTLLFLAFVALFAVKSFSQETEVVFFSQDGERFWIVIDGVLQNQEPQPRVQVGGLTKEYYRVKVIFEIEKIPDINQNISTTDVDGNKVNATYRIFKRKKKYSMWQSSWEEVPSARPGTQTIHLQTEGPSGRPQQPVTQQPVFQTEQTTVTTTTGVTVKLPDGTVITFAPGAVIDTQYLDYIVVEETVDFQPERPVATRPVKYPAPAPEPIYYVPGYTGAIGCYMPMDNNAFDRAKNTIKNNSFESDMLSTSKQVASNNCLTVNQVVEIIELFSFESTKLEFAKFAYRYTYDIGNYYEVNNAFTYSSSKQELNNYINKNK
jgi:hypothetical protein